MLSTVEDIIEYLLHKPYVATNDNKVLSSLSKQFNRQLGLTDRQLMLAQEIINNYTDELIKFSDYDSTLSNLRLPIRQIDRSKWIRIVKLDNDIKIGVRFIFNSKYISKITEMRKMSTDNSLQYDRKEKIHYFDFNEKNCYALVNLFKENSFEIQEEILTIYKKLEKVIRNRKDYAPGIFNYQLKNLSVPGKTYALELLGEPDQNNLHMYYERRRELGLIDFDSQDVKECFNKLSPLTEKLCTRTKNEIFIDADEFSLDHILHSIHSLDRFPLLILVDEENPLKDITEIQKIVSGFIDSTDISVMFRLSNHSPYGAEFNNYLKEININSPIDKSKKIVYINNRMKINKPLLKSGWQHDCFLSVGNSPYSTLKDYANSAGLNIYYDSAKNKFAYTGVNYH